MIIIHKTIFAVGFRVKADRDEFQAKLILEANKSVLDLHLTTRVVEAPDVTSDTEIGAAWFEKTTQDAVWAARIVYAFTDEAENKLFHDSLVAKFGTKDGKYNYYVDGQGKVGAFNLQKAPLREVADLTNPQVDLR